MQQLTSEYLDSSFVEWSHQILILCVYFRSPANQEGSQGAVALQCCQMEGRAISLQHDLLTSTVCEEPRASWHIVGRSISCSTL